MTLDAIMKHFQMSKGGNKNGCQQCIKKIGQKVLNRKVCVHLPSRQIFKFGIIENRKDN
jgi:hypothetical protein